MNTIRPMLWRMDSLARFRWQLAALAAGCTLATGFAALSESSLRADEPARAKSGEAQKQAPAKPESAKSDSAASAVIAATVNGEPIRQREVEREVERALAGNETTPALRQMLAAQALQQLVDRRVILAYLEREGQAASGMDVDVALARFAAQLTRRGTTIDAYVREAGIDEAALRVQFKWQATWRKYLEQYFTDENLEKFFSKRRRDFDGTQLKVAHILWKVDAKNADASRAAALESARKVHAEIKEGKVAFAAAAAQHSAAPTGKQGGDIGLIERRQPMPESFSRAAFALAKGEVSEPVTTEIGVHLITVLDEIPGPKTLKEVRGEVELAMSQYLFEWLAGRERSKMKIEFTGKSPYFDPQSGAVVAPKE